ncbi:HK97 gp10 family phage protein [Synechococcus sp. N5]|uniref:HK97 gp10 family phage protein n=1 Tax=Synechococcus sp. N5 TaxID=2575515 RepID=UPI000E0E9EE5|nr:HK97 gp10 family phage protein [Synechococcus sp. N5]|tara:strand:+ start:44672 stop:45028 length:357 start_codon:yes stop_codon:yes gene_type:complete
MPETTATIPEAQIKNFMQRMRRLPEEIKPEVLEDMGDGIVGEAQTTAPIDTGALSESHYREDFDGDGVVIGVNVDYGLAVHETHPSKSKWFLNAINRNFARVGRKAIIKALRSRGAES